MHTIAEGAAVFFDRTGAGARLGVLTYTDLGPACVPMADRLQRGTLIPVDLDSLIAVASIQGELPTREEGDPFGPVVEIQAGTILAMRVPADPTRYRLYEVVEDLIHAFADYDPTTPVRVRNFDIVTGPYGDPFVLHHQGAHSICGLGSVAHLQYRAVPDRFLQVLRTSIITEWEVENVAVTATFPTKMLSGPASLTFRDGGASATLQSPERPLLAEEATPVEISDVFAKLKDGRILPTSPSTPAWTASRVIFSGVSLGSPDSLFRFRVPEFTVVFAEGEPTATRETIRGLTLSGFSHRIIPEFPTGWNVITARDAYCVTIFGRDARIVQSAANHVSVIHEGPPLESEAVTDVVTLLQYLCGNRGQHLSTETFSDTERLEFQFQERSATTKRGLAPIRIDHWTSTTELVARDFTTMLTGIRQLRDQTPVKVDAALHHYFEGVNSSYPVTRILMLAVAIDTLVALKIGNQRQVNIIPNTAFQHILVEVRVAALAALKSEGVQDPALTQMMNKLDGLNHPSARQRQRDFWTELGIQLTVEESSVLETRHQVVHEGHVGSERTSDALWDNYRRSGILANLFNRAMLTLLGWTGSYLDATAEDKRLEIPMRRPQTGAS